jgi:hypothetical protein
MYQVRFSDEFGMYHIWPLAKVIRKIVEKMPGGNKNDQEAHIRYRLNSPLMQKIEIPYSKHFITVLREPEEEKPKATSKQIAERIQATANYIALKK